MSGAPAGVELWFLDVARAGSALAAVERSTPRLSADELEWTAEPGRNAETRRHYFRICLRLLLERFVGPRLRRVPFRTSPQGKPQLPWDAGVMFSLSHSGPYGLIAIADREVGVDIEQDRPVHFPPDRQDALLAAARGLSSAPAGSPLTILQAWVRLEAWSKARATGIGVLLHDLGIKGPEWAARGPARDFEGIAASLARQEGFVLYDIALPRPFHAALATKAGLALPLLRIVPAGLSSLEALAASQPDPSSPSDPNG